jgi:hypothetical protein|nr:MAG TPA: hypothetical protein [Caudoviricetes sp.]
MDFYSVDCKREIFKNGKWEANNRTEMLVVLAENKEDALKKINNSLNNRGTDNVKYVLSSEIIRRNGLLFVSLFGDGDVAVPV